MSNLKWQMGDLIDETVFRKAARRIGIVKREVEAALTWVRLYEEEGGRWASPRAAAECFRVHHPRKA